MKLLFVCTQNRLRSATAERVFNGRDGVEALGAGTEADAPRTVSAELIEWADAILVMEKTHRNRLEKKFRAQLAGKRLIVLGIPDDYEFMDPALVSLLEREVSGRIKQWARAGLGQKPPAL